MLPNKPPILCHYWSDSDNTKFLPNIIGRCIIHRPVISDGIVVPPWEIRNAIPTGVQDLDLLKELRNFPNNYKSGESLIREVSDQLKKFLLSLPENVSITWIKACLSNKQIFPRPKS